MALSVINKTSALRFFEKLHFPWWPHLTSCPRPLHPDAQYASP